MNDEDFFKLLVQLKMRENDKERERIAMNMANEVYVTYRMVEGKYEFITEYDGVFVSERDATLHLEETYGKDWYAQGYRKLKQYIAKY